jgi:LDH2 family malate/lactate/ureidoglycolate dehydrogenase
VPFQEGFAMPDRYRHTDLVACAAGLFAAAGLDRHIAATVAVILVEADMLGVATHGLQFVPAYTAGIEAGRTARSGEPDVLTDNGSALLLDAKMLPGQWVVMWALNMALHRLKQHPVVTVAVRHSENISCLATYMKRAAEQGAMAILTTSSPGNRAVAPFGGREARYSTNPIAFGIPTDGTPILIDTSTSSTTNRNLERTQRLGAKLAQPVVIDNRDDGRGNAGKPSDDPAAFFADPPGAIMPAGGLEQGHKGFAFAILVEALTSGLAGVGRRDPKQAAGSNLFLQLIDPSAFGGADAFKSETGFFAAMCRDTPPLDAAHPVRVPGDRALALYREQMEKGVALHPEIMPRMAPLLEKYGVEKPRMLGDEI